MYKVQRTVSPQTIRNFFRERAFFQIIYKKKHILYAKTMIYHRSTKVLNIVKRIDIETTARKSEKDYMVGRSRSDWYKRETFSLQFCVREELF